MFGQKKILQQFSKINDPSIFSRYPEESKNQYIGEETNSMESEHSNSKTFCRQEGKFEEEHIKKELNRFKVGTKKKDGSTPILFI